MLELETLGDFVWRAERKRGNKSISLGSDSLCTWAERSQLGHQLVSLTKQPELLDGGGGSAKGAEGMVERLNVGRFGYCSQGSASRHRRAKTGRSMTSMHGTKNRSIRQQRWWRRGAGRKGDKFFCNLECKHACLCKLEGQEVQRIPIISPF